MDGTSEWQQLYTINNKSVQEIFDTNYEAGKIYSYAIVATDSSKLESAPAIPLTVNIPENHSKEAISVVCQAVGWYLKCGSLQAGSYVWQIQKKEPKIWFCYHSQVKLQIDSDL